MVSCLRALLLPVLEFGRVHRPQGPVVRNRCGFRLSRGRRICSRLTARNHSILASVITLDHKRKSPQSGGFVVLINELQVNINHPL